MNKARSFLLVVVTACGGPKTPAAPPTAKPVVEDKQPTVAASGPAGMAPAELGKQLFESKGCVACHSIDGSPRVGPSLKGVFGTQVKLEGGGTVVFDDAYFRESVLTPQAKLVAGFPPVQPSYEGQLSDAELAGLLAYVKSL